jgi:hypothetical protein
MADTKDLLDFLEGGIGMFFDMRLELLGVELAPMPPALFRGQRALFGGDEIPINGTPSQIKPPGGLGFGAAALNEFHHPFPQVQRIGFHALKPITLCPNVNMKCYSGAKRRHADFPLSGSNHGHE